MARFIGNVVGVGMKMVYFINQSRTTIADDMSFTMGKPIMKLMEVDS